MAVTTLLLVLAALPAGAFLNRLRGGLLGDQIRAALGGGRIAKVLWGTQGARIFSWGVPWWLATWALGTPWWGAVAMGALAWVGTTWGQSDALAMGHRPGGAHGAQAWAGMTLWGLARVAPGAFMLASYLMGAREYFEIWLLVAGLACAPIYDVVWRVPSWAYLRGFGYGDGPATGYDPPELAEALHGALMAAALVLAAA